MLKDDGRVIHEASTIIEYLQLHYPGPVRLIPGDPGFAIEVRMVSIPGEWVPPVPGVFIKETMNNLADLGTKMGADPTSWSTAPPAF